MKIIAFKKTLSDILDESDTDRILIFMSLYIACKAILSYFILRSIDSLLRGWTYLIFDKDNMEEARGGGSQGGESKISLDPEVKKWCHPGIHKFFLIFSDIDPKSYQSRGLHEWKKTFINRKY